MLVVFALCLSVSLAPKPKAAPKKYESYNPKYKTDEEKKEEVRGVGAHEEIGFGSVRISRVDC